MRILFVTSCLLLLGAGLGLCAALLLDALCMFAVWRAADHPVPWMLGGALVVTMLVALAGKE